jgi:hypothetical protein
VQLPPGDELVLMSGRTPAQVAPDEWPSLPLRPSAQTQTTDVRQDEDTANSGLRQEPDLPDHVAITRSNGAAAGEGVRRGR